MRTAEQILKERFPFYSPDVYGKDVELNGEAVSELINDARIEAIKECAKRATTTWDKGHIYIESAYVNKQSILQLINEVK